MTDWNPKDIMGQEKYRKFKSGNWVEVPTVPEWVSKTSNPPQKTDIEVNSSVSAVFSGDSLLYKVVTYRKPRGAGTFIEQKYEVRIKNQS